MPSAAARDGTPTAPRHHAHYHPGYPTASATAAHIIGRAPAVDYSAGLSKIPIATGDVGSMGGLTPDNWGLPYKGKNPAMALFMASAGVTLRMAVNVAVIYCIYTYWLNDGPDSSSKKGAGNLYRGSERPVYVRYHLVFPSSVLSSFV